MWECFQPGLVIQRAFNTDKRQQLHTSVFLQLGKFLVSVSRQTHMDTLMGTTVLTHPHTQAALGGKWVTFA